MPLSGHTANVRAPIRAGAPFETSSRARPTFGRIAMYEYGWPQAAILLALALLGAGYPLWKIWQEFWWDGS
jgi:hypothetical protein